MTDSIERLYVAVRDASDTDPVLSRTVKLRREGVPKMAKKVAEEAAEVAIEAVTGAREPLIRESADLLYNLVVLWSAAGISPQDVYDEMDRRERLYGVAQKVPKGASYRTVATRATPADAPFAKGSLARRR
jgi:phosphoribosyl-ATP pyrophosphohydrolase